MRIYPFYLWEFLGVFGKTPLITEAAHRFKSLKASQYLSNSPTCAANSTPARRRGYHIPWRNTPCRPHAAGGIKNSLNFITAQGKNKKDAVKLKLRFQSLGIFSDLYPLLYNTTLFTAAALLQMRASPSGSEPAISAYSGNFQRSAPSCGKSGRKIRTPPP